MPKIICLALAALLTVLSLLLIMPVYSEITKPSVPDFAIRLVDNSYDVPTTYSTDPYTGATITHPGHRVTNKSVELVIKNQPIVSTNVEGWTTSLFYNVRMKGHYGGDWLTLYDPTITPLYVQLDSENTVISFPYSVSGSYLSVGPLSGLPLNAEIDFQVEALAGYVHRVSNSSATNPIEKFPWVFEGETSGWSNTQTITLTADAVTDGTSTHAPTNLPSSSSQPSGGSSLFGLDVMGLIIVGMLGAIVVLLMLVMFYLRKRIR